jgi:phosphohistidine swiveling domain-containing protein
MKAIKNILYFDAVDQSSGAPIFEALFKQLQASDAVLANAGLNIQTAGYCKDGEPAHDDIKAALAAAGIEGCAYKHTFLPAHPELVRRADMILVSTLLEEDNVCMNYHEARSKTNSILSYLELRQEPDNAEASTKCGRYDPTVTWYKELIPILFKAIKNSYCDALILRGQCLWPGTIMGTAFVAKSGDELEKFPEGSIMVVDRPGIFLAARRGRTDAAWRARRAAPENDDTLDLKKEMDKYIAEVEGRTDRLLNYLFQGDGYNYLRKAIKGSKGFIFSRGRNRGERAAIALGIPCISSCVGATDEIATGQVIVIDAGRGEVYDAARLLKL